MSKKTLNKVRVISAIGTIISMYAPIFHLAPWSLAAYVFAPCAIICAASLCVGNEVY
jgi:hypothetical protein